MISIISPMWAVAFGSICGGAHPSTIMSSLNAAMFDSDTSVALMPASWARLMILSSTSVKLRTNVTS